MTLEISFPCLLYCCLQTSSPQFILGFAVWDGGSPAASPFLTNRWLTRQPFPSGLMSLHSFLARTPLPFLLWGLGPSGVKFSSSLPHCTSSKPVSCAGFFIPGLFIITNNVEDDFLNHYLIGCLLLFFFFKFKKHF